MDDDETLTHPLTPTLRSTGSWLVNAPWGALSLLTSLLYLSSSIVELIWTSNSPHRFTYHYVIFGSPFRDVCWVLALAALMTPGARSRRLGTIALLMWAATITMLAVYTQWHLNGNGGFLTGY